MKKEYKKMTQKIKVDIHKGKNKVFTLYVKDRKDMYDKVRNTLYENGIEEEKAIDCAKWCELAADGECYMEEDFDVYAESIV